MDARSSCSTKLLRRAARSARGCARCSMAAAASWSSRAAVAPRRGRRSGARCFRRRSARSSIGRLMPAARCRRSTTRIRSSSCSTRRAAATSRRRAFIGIARSRRSRARLCSARFDDGSPALVERSGGQRASVVDLGVDDRLLLDEPAAAAGVPAVRAPTRQARRAATPIRGRGSSTGDVLDLSRHGELTAPFRGGRAADSATRADRSKRRRARASG